MLEIVHVVDKFVTVCLTEQVLRFANVLAEQRPWASWGILVRTRPRKAVIREVGQQPEDLWCAVNVQLSTCLPVCQLFVRQFVSVYQPLNLLTRSIEARLSSLFGKSSNVPPLPRL